MQNKLSFSKETEEKTKKSLNEEVQEIAVTFTVDEQVKIVAGPFTNFTGVIVVVDSEEKTLTVMVRIFNKSQPIRVGFTQVEKV